MGECVFSPIALDAIGEIFNISLGSSATAVSNMLARRVDITTPTVEVVAANDFSLGKVQPAIGVTISYVAGLSGNNVMLLKRSDVRTIVDLLMGMDTADEDFVINELNLSAICEVMNQMMGASSTALSDFLGRMVNISTPEATEITDIDSYIMSNFPSEGQLVVIRFNLNIEEAVQSEFMSALSCDLARELLLGFDIKGKDVGLPDDEVDEVTVAPAPAAAEPPAPAPTAPPVAEPAPVQQPVAAAAPPQPSPQQTAQVAPAAPAPEVAMPVAAAPAASAMDANAFAAAMSSMQQMMNMQMQQIQQHQMQQQAAMSKTIRADKPSMPQFDNGIELTDEQEGNLDLLMGVPVDVSVEIGRTRRRVKDILNYTKGSLVVLDRLAGDRADLYVNGKCIARGDIVVVDDSFGLRIAEIIEPLALEDIK